MIFELTILGCSSAVPVHGRFLSSQILDVGGRLILIDCGEGTQFRLVDFRISKNKIENILISHLHGDHIFGLPGLINSMNLAGRNKSLNIFGPIGLENYLNNVFEASYSHSLGFELFIHQVDHTVYSKITENENLKIYAFPLEHRIPTIGYKIVEKQSFKNIRPESISKYNLNFNQIREAKIGKDLYLKNGEVIKNNDLTFDLKKSRSYAYCSDTRYNEKIVAYIQNIELLYHEATYLKELKDKAKERFHSTAIEAATIAKKSNAKKLILGHYSSRYKNLEPLLREAKTVFQNTELGIDGVRFQVNLENNE